MTKPSQLRREREQQELKQNILEAAQAIATEEGGWQKVTMREIADRVEYTHPTIYKYFDSKEAILYQLVRDGFARLGKRVEAAWQGVTDRREVVLKVAEAYWQFAFDYTLLYELMHNLSGISFGTTETPTEAREAFVRLREVVELITQDSGDELDDATDQFWALLHGWVSLTAAGRIKGGAVRAKALMLRGALVQFSL